MLTDGIDLNKMYSPLMQDQLRNMANPGSQNTAPNEMQSLPVPETGSPPISIQGLQNETFADALKGFVADVNSQQIQSKNITESFIKGEPVDIHDVMITAEKAKTSFELLMELRNKGLDLYREVLRMQI